MNILILIISSNNVIEGRKPTIFLSLNFRPNTIRPNNAHQNHAGIIGVHGTDYRFHRERVKKHILIMGEDKTTSSKISSRKSGQEPLLF